jgi:hypothetical protein
LKENHCLCYRSTVIRLKASRTATGDIFSIPLNGEYIDMMMRIAAETASAQTITKLRVGNVGFIDPKAINVDAVDGTGIFRGLHSNLRFPSRLHLIGYGRGKQWTG